MKKFIPAALIVAAIASGCATQPTPNKKPMQQSTVDQLKGLIPLIMQIPERNGVATTYFAQDSSSAGAQYGLIGALTTSIIDGIANASPAEIASTNANLIAKTIKGDELINQAYAALVANKNNAPANLNLVFSAPTPAPATSKKAVTPDGLNVDVGYRLGSDMSGVYVYATATLNAKGLTYTSPYKASKPDTSGKVYENNFHYYSEQFEIPSKPQSEIDAKVAEIKAAANKNGVAPKRGSPELARMADKIKQAKEPYTQKEIADKLVSQWLANDGEKLKAEIKSAHEFIATQLYKDLTRFDVPDYKGADTVIETLANGRVIKILGNGVNAGVVQSEPKNFTTGVLGNVVVYAESEEKEKPKAKTRKKAK